MENTAFKLVWIQNGKRRYTLFNNIVEANKCRSYFGDVRKWETEVPAEVPYSKEDGPRYPSAAGFLSHFGYLGPISYYNTSGGPQRC